MIILFRLNYFGTSHKNTLPFFVTVIVDEHWVSQYWTITLRGRFRTRFLWVLVTFLLTNQYITLFCIFFYLKTTYLTYIINSTILNSLSIPEWSVSPTYFVFKTHHGLLVLSDTSQLFSTAFSHHFNMSDNAEK
jgi:hypothetical protein